MTTKQAKQEGVKAFNAGRGSAPALNNKFILAACADEDKTNLLLKAYSEGWHVANCASGVTDPSFPSLRMLVAINEG